MAIKIMIDPGHFYGVNKMSCGYAEGTRMWVLYTMLRPMLEEYGFTVGTTRTSTYDYPKTSSGDDNVTGRGRMAKGYDLMLSLHTNACDTESVNRPVIIYPISGKCRDLSEALGNSLQKCMGLQKYQIMQRYNSYKNADYYGVIRGAASVGVPCLIIEHTFHTNNTMAKWLMVDENLKKVAQCVADTLAAYYGYKKKEPVKTETPEREDDDDMVRYKRLSDIPNGCGFRDIIEQLMNADILKGDGSDPTGNNDIIDLSHDMVRTLVLEYRGGAFDRKLISKGMAPAVHVSE